MIIVTKLALMEAVTSAYLTISVNRRVKRTWKERLFEKPWHPMIKTKLVYSEIPDPKVYMIGNILYCHPATLKRLRQALETKGGDTDEH